MAWGCQLMFLPSLLYSVVHQGNQDKIWLLIYAKAIRNRKEITCAHLPYMSITAKTVEGKFDAVTPCGQECRRSHLPFWKSG